MKKKNKNLLYLFVLLLISFGFLFFNLKYPFKHSKILSSPTILVTHTDDTNGFSITYPKSIIPEITFPKYTFLGNWWMAGAQDGVKGTPILCIPVFRVINENSYPRYYNVEVRIGVTLDPRELQTFLSKSVYTNTPPEEVMIGRVTFYRFPIEDAGMMKFISGYSYRTIHNGKGFAIEQIKTGSNYKEDKSTKDLTDATLDTYFKQAGSIVKSFQFID